MATFHATTIVAVRRENGDVCIGGDGQVTMGETSIMKHSAKKVRKIYKNTVLAGFAGSVADAFTLTEKFEKKLEEHGGNLKRAAVALAQMWRSDRAMRNLEALMLAADHENILLISGRDLVLMAGLSALVVAGAWRFYPQIEASAFDEEFARTRGVRTDAVFLAVLAVVAVSVVLLQTFVGIVMVIAMLTLPSGTAGFAARNLRGMMVLASLLSALFSVGGLALSWRTDLPSGAVVVVLSGAVFLGASGFRMLAARKSRPRTARPRGK